LRKFLWGTIHKKRYLTLIAWTTVCQDRRNEGLGIRDLQKMNDALVLKLVWNFMARSDKQLVAVMRAKYCTIMVIWEVTAIVEAASLWKHMVELKEFLRGATIWVIGNGTNIPAIGQPWFDQWDEAAETNSMSQRVADLVGEDGTGWNRPMLIQLVGELVADQICRTIPPPVPNALLPDRLVWAGHTSGVYSVKAGYDALTNGGRQEIIRSGRWSGRTSM
jgi:hypothetical protein